MQPPFTRLFSILNAIVSFTQKFDYPIAEPNFRQERSGVLNDNVVRPLPFVSTEVGNFEGYFMKGLSRDIYAFEGIPYAETPIRFHDPILKKPFEGNFSAKSVGNDCLQINQGSVIGGRGIFGSEDCNVCQIYSPEISSKGRNPNFPVIFNIHGGSFEVGTSRDYGPVLLLEQDVVLVVCNYRLGAFGFLSTGDKIAPGNFGLKDLALALDWTHKHIRNFGGDPNKIVVMGQSAGAALGHLLMMSPKAKNLISGAIIISGNAFVPWAVMDSELAMKMTWRFAILNFCPTNQGSIKLIECLRRRPARVLVATQNLLHVTEQSLFQFSPVIEPDIPGALITNTPLELYRLGSVAKIPAMFSVNSRDTDTVNIILKLIGDWSLIGKSILVNSPTVLGYHGKVGNENEVTAKILDFYGGMEKMLDERVGIFEAAQDRHFRMGWRKSLQLHSELAPTFAYVFDYHSNRGIAGKLLMNSEDFGVPHAEDLFFVFNRTDIKLISTDHRDYTVVKHFQKIFINFANYGQPFHKNNSELEQTTIEPVRPPPSKSFNMFVIDEEIQFLDLPWETNITRFWNSLNIQEFPSLKN